MVGLMQYYSLADFGYEIHWLVDYAMFDVTYKGQHWGAIEFRASAMQTLSREYQLMDSWYGTGPNIVWC